MVDSEIKPILEFKESSDEKTSWKDIAPFHPTTKRYWALWDSFHLRNGVLYRKRESDDGKFFRWQLIHPKTRVLTVLKELHGSLTGGHFGVMKTLQKVRERFYWNNEWSDGKSVVAHVIPVLHLKVPENALEEDCSCIMYINLPKASSLNNNSKLQYLNPIESSKSRHYFCWLNRLLLR
ncbi:retrovirus-related Pol polyprotein from transposon 412 [Trichonephila clavipes]|nr:retrovirus-related Pol polyprotein from transposon 412 [Trichonephila clavipes]